MHTPLVRQLFTGLVSLQYNPMESSGTTVDTDQTEVESGMEIEASEDTALEKTESKKLDLAFAMDCTGSMGSYIQQAQQVWWAYI